jgi:hypothetical protein
MVWKVVIALSKEIALSKSNFQVLFYSLVNTVVKVVHENATLQM